MGFQEKKEGEGSRLILSEAKLLSANGTPVDGLGVEAEDSIVKLCHELPIRQHVRIDHRGTAVKNGKFDEEIVPKGARFCFEMELMGEEDCQELMDKILTAMLSDSFRVGSGSRNGFGKIAVKEIRQRCLNLINSEDLKLYLGKSSSLAEEWEGFKPYSVNHQQESDNTTYTLKLHPTDFMFFGSGFGDEHSDMTFVREPVIVWSDDNKADIIQRDCVILIPASSVKGALSHRTAYHYNKKQGAFADKIAQDELEAYTGKANDAVLALFGSEGNNKDKKKSRGKVLFSDVTIEKKASLETKVLNHVKIDRFTGGAVDGALFSEEVLYTTTDEEIELSLMLSHSVTNHEAIEAFEEAMKDICRGRLPLGGGINRGNGTFTGSLTKNQETIYEYNAKH